MIEILNAIIASLANVLNSILSVLPTTPFNWSSNYSGFLSVINWLIPIPIIIIQLEAFVSAVAIYYGLRIVLRWIKAAGN